MNPKILPQKYVDILLVALEKTKKGLLSWSETEDHDVYQAALTDIYSLRIMREENRQWNFAAYDEKGNRLFYISSFEHAASPLPLPLLFGTSLPQILEELYRLARNKALNIDKKVDEMKRLLDDLPPF